MKKITDCLDYEAIRKRIDTLKQGFRPSEWADLVGVKINMVTNIHGKTKQRPSIQYIVSVALATGKSVDYFLWGVESDGILSRDPEINELLRNAKYVLEADHPEITPALRSNIVAFHGSIQRERFASDTKYVAADSKGEKTGPGLKTAGG